MNANLPKNYKIKTRDVGTFCLFPKVTDENQAVEYLWTCFIMIETLHFLIKSWIPLKTILRSSLDSKVFKPYLYSFRFPTKLIFKGLTC